MKLRLFHRNKPAGIQVPAVCDTLSRVSVACIELTPEGELTDINMQAYKVLRLGGGFFPSAEDFRPVLRLPIPKRPFARYFRGAAATQGLRRPAAADVHPAPQAPAEIPHRRPLRRPIRPAQEVAPGRVPVPGHRGGNIPEVHPRHGVVADENLSVVLRP